MPGTRTTFPIRGGPIVLFDGVCNLCNGTVNWIIARDRRGQFQFAALQSEAGHRLLADMHVPAGVEEAMLLVLGRRCFSRSTAALTIARMLGWPWQLWYGFILVPRSIRDRVYDFVANRRYRWFGRLDTCRVPTRDIKGRFLE